MALADYQQDMETCCRCSACKFVPLENVKGVENSYICPSIARYNFHGYSGGGRMDRLELPSKTTGQAASISRPAHLRLDQA